MLEDGRLQHQQVVGVARVHAVGIEIAGDVGTSQAELAVRELPFEVR